MQNKNLEKKITRMNNFTQDSNLVHQDFKQYLSKFLIKNLYLPNCKKGSIPELLVNLKITHSFLSNL
jgi:hypothetical protein